jgi:hypothetical protein
MSFGRGEVRVQTVREDPRSLILGASTPLAFHPKRTAAGLVVVPEKDRRFLEEGIEHFGNLMAVALNTERRISSIGPQI